MARVEGVDLVSEPENRLKQPKRKATKSSFKPGQSGNPGGRPRESQIERLVKKLTKETYAELVNLLMSSTEQEVMDYLNGPNVPLEQTLFIRHILDLAEKPNWVAYDKYLDRRIGKVKEEMDLSIRPGVKVIDLEPIGKKIVLGKNEEEEE